MVPITSYTYFEQGPNITTPQNFNSYFSYSGSGFPSTSGFPSSPSGFPSTPSTPGGGFPSTPSTPGGGFPSTPSTPTPSSSGFYYGGSYTYSDLNQDANYAYSYASYASDSFNNNGGFGGFGGSGYSYKNYYQTLR